MKSALLTAVAVIGVFAPVATFAATYEYVNTNGVLETETAANAAQALTMPSDIAANSGVILVPGSTSTTVTTTSTGNSMDMGMGSSTMMTASSSSMMASSTMMTASSTSMTASSSMMMASSSQM